MKAISTGIGTHHSEASDGTSLDPRPPFETGGLDPKLTDGQPFNCAVEDGTCCPKRRCLGKDPGCVYLVYWFRSISNPQVESINEIRLANRTPVPYSLSHRVVRRGAGAAQSARGHRPSSAYRSAPRVRLRRGRLPAWRPVLRANRSSARVLSVV